MRHGNYVITKTGHYGNPITLKETKEKGFRINPKNKVKYDGVQVREMIFFNTSFIKRIVERKTRIKLESYLKYIMHILTMIDESGEDGGTIDIALNDLERYRRMIINKYNLYLDERYTELLLEKISVYERELRMRQAYMMAYPEEMEKDEHRTR